MNLFGTFVFYCIHTVNISNPEFPKLYEVMEFRSEEIISYGEIREVKGERVCQYMPCTIAWKIDETSCKPQTGTNL